MRHLLFYSLKDVQKRTENVNAEEDPSGWRPYNTFYESLLEKCAKNEGIQGTSELHFNHSLDHFYAKYKLAIGEGCNN